MPVSYSIRLRTGYFRGHCRRIRRWPQTTLIESLAEGEYPRGEGQRRFRGPVLSPPLAKDLPACFAGPLGAADDVFQDAQRNQE